MQSATMSWKLEGASSSEAGWLSLARSGLETDPVRMADYVDQALSTARDFGDAELRLARRWR